MVTVVPVTMMPEAAVVPDTDTASSGSVMLSFNGVNVNVAAPRVCPAGIVSRKSSTTV